MALYFTVLSVWFNPPSHPCTLRHRKHIWSWCCVSFSFMSPQFPKIWVTKGNSLPHKFSHTQLNPLGLLVVYNYNSDQMQLSWNNLRASHAMQSTAQSYVYYISNSSATGSRVVVMIYRKLYSIFFYFTFILLSCELEVNKSLVFFPPLKWSDVSRLEVFTTSSALLELLTFAHGVCGYFALDFLFSFSSIHRLPSHTLLWFIVQRLRRVRSFSSALTSPLRRRRHVDLHTSLRNVQIFISLRFHALHSFLKAQSDAAFFSLSTCLHFSSFSSSIGEWDCIESNCLRIFRAAQQQEHTRSEFTLNSHRSWSSACCTTMKRGLITPVWTCRIEAAREMWEIPIDWSKN